MGILVESAAEDVPRLHHEEPRDRLDGRTLHPRSSRRHGQVLHETVQRISHSLLPALAYASHHHFQFLEQVGFQQEVEGRGTERVYHILVESTVENHHESLGQFLAHGLQHLETRLTGHLHVDEQHIGLQARDEATG